MKSVEDFRGAKLYIDSNVFIYAFEGATDAPRRASGLLLRKIFARQCAAATSLISRAEVLVRPLRLKQIDLEERYRALLSGTGAIALWPVDKAVADRAAQLRADYPAIKLPDALHIATAMRAGCDALITADQRLGVVSPRIAVLSLEQLTGA